MKKRNYIISVFVLAIATFSSFKINLQNNFYKKIKLRHVYNDASEKSYFYFNDTINYIKTELFQFTELGVADNFPRILGKEKLFNDNYILVKINNTLNEIPNWSEAVYLVPEGIGAFNYAGNDYFYIGESLFNMAGMNEWEYLLFKKSNRYKFIGIRSFKKPITNYKQLL